MDKYYKKQVEYMIDYAIRAIEGLDSPMSNLEKFSMQGKMTREVSDEIVRMQASIFVAYGIIDDMKVLREIIDRDD